MSVIEKFSKVEIIFLDQGGQTPSRSIYKVKVDGHEIKGVQGIEVNQNTKDFPYPIVTISILPSELIEYVHPKSESNAVRKDARTSGGVSK